ncbi:N-acetylmannosamine-6-phosphate 2-epimerase [Ketogulonicigenium vulgare]|uniref:Putative N-acetylmannosamine-6-phosphate 2-epimerase n=1 Tax=Ketogulonicigenium vulgare (strain WSH-001) TaxID=759362 RepID=F9Y4V8_KETVW|nr:N-acetylmannosamine-6-phosphate 2-epimerase [Ketogulonicigenium vulgare]ADO43566.1 N-acetylmannosamine-6-phosphate epimerase [Ketogulonicigenium vulgare Y25]AEM41842.1 N-acetylmannosamine-6-phosphate epimerase, putative [Ketogulonicigenium vulgare WSH-001]ALJ81948.1 N-acetylmannosamine-6-phosphate 2-epimerase [Ketogulonicigenium vulgare]ANW34589.1 N-acetylmannosamine-6-phosphate 2-epimerase [Ketogulonicigenium vulgare]AOZ55600.1 N-acetylmannosamine-6-phosphate epimerase [Ketogulonicigenium 
MTLFQKGGLIVSCQARADNPLHGPVFMAAMAEAAEDGGAVALRVNGVEDISAIKAVTHLPVIGIFKMFDHDPVYITPMLGAVDALVEAGADIIAYDATFRARPKGDPVEAILERIHAHGKLAFADISTFDEGVAAAAAGADIIATTLAGYTAETQGTRGAGPDLELVRRLSQALSIPVIAEGRYNTPALAASGLQAGAYGVVVGTMITNPREITRSFVQELQQG